MKNLVPWLICLPYFVYMFTTNLSAFFFFPVIYLVTLASHFGTWAMEDYLGVKRTMIMCLIMVSVLYSFLWIQSIFSDLAICVLWIASFLSIYVVGTGLSISEEDKPKRKSHEIRKDPYEQYEKFISENHWHKKKSLINTDTSYYSGHYPRRRYSSEYERDLCRDDWARSDPDNRALVELFEKSSARDREAADKQWR